MTNSASGKVIEIAPGRRLRDRTGEGPYHKGNVKASLVSAARRLLETETVEAITARRLCREVGVSSANFYNHFDSLEQLFLDVAAEGFASRAAENRRLLKRGGAREDMLVQLAQNLVEFACSEPELFRLMFGQLGDVSSHPHYVSQADDSFRVLVQIVHGEDLYRPEDLEHSHEACKAAYAFFSFIYGLARSYSQGLIANASGTRAERRRFVEDLTRQVITGIRG